MSPDQLEPLTLWGALVGYVAITIWSILAVAFKRPLGHKLFVLIALSALLHTASLGLRWYNIGHLPVIASYEMLSANIWGLMVAVAIGYQVVPRARAFVAFVMPIIIMLMAWMLLRPDDPSSKPSTFDTLWLFIHIGFIKLFLGCAFIALGMALIVLLRHLGIGHTRLANLPDDRGLDARAYRFMALALIFDTLGVVAGAIWAQDAWGRYWSWDPLEVWSLITWLCIGLTLHLRSQFHTSPVWNAGFIVATWIVAFFTFFGIPFVSVALHKGVI